MNSTFASDPAEFINRIVADNHIPHLTNRYPSDINLGLGDQRDLPTKDQSVYDFLRKPEEPLDDLGFFDRTVPAKLFPNMAGSTGPDQDFWEPQLVNRYFADINPWFEDQPDLPTRDQSEYDFLRNPAESLDDLDFFDRKDPARLFREMAGSTGLDQDFWERQPVNRDLADMDSWFEGPNDLPGKGWSLKDFLRKPEEPPGDLGFFDESTPGQSFRDIAGSTGPHQEVGNEQPGIAQLQNGIQYDQDAQMNPAGDIAQQQANLDNAWSDYQPAVDEYSTHYHSEEPEADWQDGAFDNPEEDEEWDWDGEPDVSDPGEASGQETQDSKSSDIPEPDKQENPFKQRFLDQLTARGHSQEDALKAWEEVRSGSLERISAVISGLKAGMTLEEANRFADFRPRMQSDAEVMGLVMGVAGAAQAAGFGLRYALSQAAKAEAAGESTLAALWKRVADYLPGGGAAVEGEAAAPSASGAAGTRSWDLGPCPRGEAIEAQLGKNTPSIYPVIDKFENGVATSIKSMDLGSKTYQDPGKIARIGRGYIDKAARFEGARSSDVNIRLTDITARAMDLAVPPGATEAQQAALQGLIEYGAQNGVKVRIITVP